LRQLYSFYKTSPKRQAALVKEATSTQERHRLEFEAKCLLAVQGLEDEMVKDVQEGKVLDWEQC